jgi:putative oxidoreductase
MKTLVPTRLAITLYGIVIALFGLIHFIHADIMVAAVPIPGGKIWLYLTGLALLLAGIAFIINRYVKPAGYLLALYILLVIILVQVPHAFEDLPSLTMFMKDIALMAAAIVIGNTGK